MQVLWAREAKYNRLYKAGQLDPMEVFGRLYAHAGLHREQRIQMVYEHEQAMLDAQFAKQRELWGTTAWAMWFSAPPRSGSECAEDLYAEAKKRTERRNGYSRRAFVEERAELQRRQGAVQTQIERNLTKIGYGPDSELWTKDFFSLTKMGKDDGVEVLADGRKIPKPPLRISSAMLRRRYYGSTHEYLSCAMTASLGAFIDDGRHNKPGEKQGPKRDLVQVKKTGILERLYNEHLDFKARREQLLTARVLFEEKTRRAAIHERNEYARARFKDFLGPGAELVRHPDSFLIRLHYEAEKKQAKIQKQQENESLIADRRERWQYNLRKEDLRRRREDIQKQRQEHEMRRQRDQNRYRLALLAAGGSIPEEGSDEHRQLEEKPHMQIAKLHRNLRRDRGEMVRKRSSEAKEKKELKKAANLEAKPPRKLQHRESLTKERSFVPKHLREQEGVVFSEDEREKQAKRQAEQRENQVYGIELL